jgi:hypothetical protein
MSDYTDALARAYSLKTALLDHGVEQVSIEIQTGRPGTPHGLWYDTRFIGALMHHTVSLPSQGDTPCLWLIKNGRSDLPGPLANGYLGYDRVARIICLGWANHPGEGGPLTFPKGTIPRDNGRPYLFGWECEGGIEPWTDEMHTAMARCAAGTLDWLGVDTRSQGEHKTWAPIRKVDRLNYTTDSGRAMTLKHWNDGEEEDDMFTDADRAQLATIRSVAEQTYNKANLAAALASEAVNLAHAQISVIKLDSHPSQWLIAGGTRIWIKDQSDLEELGLKGVLEYQTVNFDDSRWSYPSVGSIPDGFPQVG